MRNHYTQLFYKSRPPSAPNPKIPHIVTVVFTGSERRDWVNPHLVATLFTMGFDRRVYFSYQPIHAIHPIDAARNLAVESAFKLERSHPAWEWIIMFDNDIGPPLNVLDTLLDAPPEADIVILPYWVWTDVGPLVCFGRWEDGRMLTPDNGELGPGWNEGGAGGTGAMFIRRRVFSSGKLTKPYFQIHADSVRGQTTTEDIDFTSRAKEAGFRIFTHRESICNHFRTVDLAEVNVFTSTTINLFVEAVRKKCKEAGMDIGTITELLRPDLVPK